MIKWLNSVQCQYTIYECGMVVKMNDLTFDHALWWWHIILVTIWIFRTHKIKKMIKYAKFPLTLCMLIRTVMNERWMIGIVCLVIFEYFHMKCLTFREQPHKKEFHALKKKNIKSSYYLHSAIFFRFHDEEYQTK